MALAVIVSAYVVRVPFESMQARLARRPKVEVSSP